MDYKSLLQNVFLVSVIDCWESWNVCYSCWIFFSFQWHPFLFLNHFDSWLISNLQYARLTPGVNDIEHRNIAAWVSANRKLAEQAHVHAMNFVQPKFFFFWLQQCWKSHGMFANISV
jgi:hypothetical protein